MQIGVVGGWRADARVVMATSPPGTHEDGSMQLQVARCVSFKLKAALCVSNSACILAPRCSVHIL